MGGLSFNFEGPETKRENELRRRLVDLNVRSLQSDPRTMTPEEQGVAADQEYAVYNDPNTTPGRRAVAMQRMGQFGGQVAVQGYGNVPAMFSSDDALAIKQNQFNTMARGLAYANKSIAEAQASGDTALAQALTVARDDSYKSAKDMMKKLPVNKIDELTDYKSLVDLGKSTVDSISSPNLYGPLMGRVNPALAATVGNPDYTKMMQSFSGVNNQILKARSGGAVTDDEAKRFRAEIGDPTSNDFKDRMTAFTAQRRREYLTKLQVLRDVGYDIPDTLLPDDLREAMGAGKKSAEKADATGAPSRQVITTTIDANGRIVIPK